MKRSLVEIYALAVCFVTITCFAITLGVAAYDLIQIANPEFTISAHEYHKHESNKAFIESCYNDERQRMFSGLSDEDLTERRAESFQRSLKAEQRAASQSLAMTSIIIAIDAVLFFFHWMIVRRVRREVSVD